MTGSGRLLIDTGFFIALFNERDQHHASACKLGEWLDILPIILPWPILYETINTRLARQPANLARFDAIAQLPETILLDDSPYRSESYATVLAPTRPKAPLSLVDAVLCNIIEDVNVPISAMLTFNERDFLQICYEYNVELLKPT